MKVYYYEDVPNFGDMLNKHLWPFFFGDLLKKDDDTLMFGIGTLLGNKVKHTGKTVVFGSGCGYQADLAVVKDPNTFISFVRGPLTAQVLGLPADKAITDPAILTPEFYPAAAKTDDVVFIPHWETSYNPLWQRVCQLAGIKYIDPLGDVFEVIKGISSAKLVITEAMHGAILADAYRVPWIPVSTSPRINEFKWNDWAKSLGMTLPPFNYLTALGTSDLFRTLTFDRSTAKTLQDSLKNNGEAAVVPNLPKANWLMLAMNWLYYKTLSYKLRCRVEHRLMSKTGPNLDRKIDALAANGFVTGSIKRTVELMKEMAKQPGFLSDATIAEAKRQQVHVKIEELKQRLGSN